jgi:hypothetical protein
MTVRAAVCAVVVLAAAARADDRGPSVSSDALRAHVEFLASDALRGRGSATDDERVAAVYVAARLRELGLEPLGDDGGYVQRVDLERRRLASPMVHLRAGGDAPRTFRHGAEVAIARLGPPRLTAPLRRVRPGERPSAGDLRGRVVLLEDVSSGLADVARALGAGAVAVLGREERGGARWTQFARAPLPAPVRLRGTPDTPGPWGLLLEPAVADWLGSFPDGTAIELAADDAPGEAAATWNVLALLRGTGTRAGEVVVLSAHIDHLGLNPGLTGDQVFNGADDDASGVAAVLELARVLRGGGPGGRSVLFAFFGSEEAGGLGAERFADHPPLPLASMVANLELEMIGRPDPAVKTGTAWVTGYDRSDLGEVLRAHGAPLGPDPHPEEGFFQRSDNYKLALRGVVAHTVASFGLHRDYHGVDDEVERLEFAHFRQVVEGMVRPLRWLLDADFTPAWKGTPPGR